MILVGIWPESSQTGSRLYCTLKSQLPPRLELGAA